MCYRLAEPGVFACTPDMPVASSEGRMTDWQSALTVGVATHLFYIQRTKYSYLAEASKKTLEGKEKKSPYFSLSKPFVGVF